MVLLLLFEVVARTRRFEVSANLFFDFALSGLW